MTKVLDAQVDFSSFVKFDKQLLKLQGTTASSRTELDRFAKVVSPLEQRLLTLSKTTGATSRAAGVFGRNLLPVEAKLLGIKTSTDKTTTSMFGMGRATDGVSKALVSYSRDLTPADRKLMRMSKTTDVYTASVREATAEQKRLNASVAAGGNIGTLAPTSTQKGPMSASGNFLNTIGGRTNRAVLQNTAFQLQDIIVQLEMGIPLTRTLAQQLPQLLGGFGALGAGIGVLVGGALSVLPILFRDTAAEAEGLEKQTIDLSKSYEDLAEAQKMAQLSTSGLKDEFGGASSSLREFLRLQAEQASRNFEMDRQSVTQSIAEAPSFAGVVERVQEYLEAAAVVAEQEKNPERFGPKINSQGVDISPGARARDTLSMIAGNLDREYAGLREVGDIINELQNIDPNDFTGLSEIGVKLTQALQGLDPEALGLDEGEIRLMVEKIGEVTRAGFDAVFSATEKAIFRFAQGIDEKAGGLGQRFLDSIEIINEKQAGSVEALTKQLQAAESKMKMLGIESTLEILGESSATADISAAALAETIKGLKADLVEAKEAADIVRIEDLIPGGGKIYEKAMEDVKEGQENSLPVLAELIKRFEAQKVKAEALGESTEILESALAALTGQFISSAQEMALAAAIAANANAVPKGRGGAIPGPSLGSLPDVRAAAAEGAAERASRKAFEERKASILAAANRGLELATNKVDGVQVVPKTIKGGGGKTDAEREADRIFKVAEKIKSGYRTVNETLLDDIADLQTALKSGLFDEEEMVLYERALADLNQQLEYGGLSAKFFADTIEGELNNAFSSVVDGSKTVGEALLDMISNILTEIANQQFQSNISSPIATGISDWITGAIGGAIGGGTASIGSIRPKSAPWRNATGNAFDGDRNIIPFAKGGIVNRPTLFPFAKGTGLMGEAGPEAIMPLSRGPGGKLGVVAQGAGGGSNVTLIVENNGSNAEAEVRQDGSGAIRLILSAVNQDIQQGGKTYQTIRKTFGVGPMTQGRG